MELLFTVSVVIYPVVYVAAIIGLLVVNKVVQDSENKNRFAFSLLTLVALLLALYDTSVMHVWEGGTNGPASPFRVVNFLIITVSMLTIVSKFVVSFVCAINVASYLRLYDTWLGDKQPIDLLIALTVYALLITFLFMMRRILTISVLNGAPDRNRADG